MTGLIERASVEDPVPMPVPVPVMGWGLREEATEVVVETGSRFEEGLKARGGRRGYVKQHLGIIRKGQTDSKALSVCLL